MLMTVTELERIEANATGRRNCEGLAPILAPLGGGLLLELFGWQSIFWGLTLFSVLVLLGLAAWLPETLSNDMPRAPLNGALGQYRRLFGDRHFLAYGMTGGFAIAGMFAYIAGSPFVFIGDEPFWGNDRLEQVERWLATGGW